MELTQIIVNARRMLVARFSTADGDQYSAAIMPIDPSGQPYGPVNRLPVRAHVKRATTSFSRPADTNAYAAGDLVANSTAAGSVTPVSFDLGFSEVLIRSADVVSDNPAFSVGQVLRLHLFSSSPVVSIGDNGALAMGTPSAGSITGAAGYLGSIDVSVDRWFTDGAAGRGQPDRDIHVQLNGGTIIYGLVEIITANTAPAARETLTWALGIVPA